MAHGARPNHANKKHCNFGPHRRREAWRLLQIFHEDAGLLLSGSGHVAKQLGAGWVGLGPSDGV